MSGPEQSGGDAREPTLFVISSHATAVEVAALTVVLQALSASTRPGPRPRSAWSSHHRGLGQQLYPGPSGWRASALPH